MKNIKNNLFLYVIIFIVVCFGAFLVYKLAFDNKKDKEEYLVEINYNEFKEKVENKDTFILVISQTGCSHCEQYLPELERTLKEVNLKAYVVNIKNLSEEDANSFSKDVIFSGTPTTIFYTDGIEKTSLNRIVGYASRNKIIERFKSLGYIN